MNTGEVIRKYRKQNNLSMKQLGESVGVSEQAISQYERGVRSINLETLIKISDVLNIDLADLQDNDLFEKWNKLLDTDKLKKEVNEIGVFDNFLISLGYKHRGLFNSDGELEEIELKNLKTNTSKYMTEEEFNNYKNRIKNFIDFEFYNMK